LKKSLTDPAAFEVLEGGRSRVVGSLDFTTVTHLLPLGAAAIAAGHAAVIDLGGVSGSDSAGLALLIEWLSVAQDSKHALQFENIPAQLHQLAGLSEVDALLSAAASTTAVPPPAAVTAA
jgi:phospholipid transport system transporter-binding protein